jgi:hypothetical protein
MTPKQRREQDILKRKAEKIIKKYPVPSEPMSEIKNIKGSLSEKEREVVKRHLPTLKEDDDAYENYKGRLSERETEYLKNQMPSMPSTGGMGLEDESLEPGKEYLEKAKGGMIVARGSRLVKVKPTKLY